MDLESQQIHIAQICGTMKWNYALPEKCIASNVPNYPLDLNAMNQAERIINKSTSTFQKGGWNMYLHYLSMVTDESHPIDASAASRAEAFLKTFDAWEE